MVSSSDTQTSSPQLLLLDNNQVVMAIPIDGAPVLIGRSSLAQVRLSDSLISRMHAMVWVESGTLWVQDLNSTNGTALNGIQLNEPAQVTETSELTLGDTALRLVPAGVEETQPKLWLQSLDNDQIWSLTPQQYILGDDSNADIRLPGAAATLAIEDGNAAAPVYGSVRMPLTMGKPFRVGQHRLQLHDQAPPGHGASKTLVGTGAGPDSDLNDDDELSMEPLESRAAPATTHRDLRNGYP